MFRFDLFKLIVYTIYYGKKQYEDIKFISQNPNRIGEQITEMIWNGTVSFLNICNFYLFIGLSLDYDTNTLLRENKFINSWAMYNRFWYA